MGLIQRYVFSTVLMAILVVMVTLFSLQVIINLVEEVNSMRHAYGFVDVLIYSVYMMPKTVELTVPFAVLIGVLFGLGQLASSSELTVMRAAGLSVRKLGWYAMTGALVVIISGMLVSEFVAAPLEVKANAERYIKRSANVEASLSESTAGFWSRDDRGFFHVNNVGDENTIYGVARFEIDDSGSLIRTSFSRTAEHNGQEWILNDTEVVDIAKTQMSKSHYDTLPWDTSISPRVMHIISTDEDDLTIRDLWYYSNYLADENLDNSSYRLAFWEKVMQPVASLSLVFVAISFVFGPLRQVTMGFRIFTGVIVGIIFSTVQHILGPVSLVYGLSPLLAVILPIAVCLGIGLLLLKKAK